VRLLALAVGGDDPVPAGPDLLAGQWRLIAALGAAPKARANGYLETSFLPWRRFGSPADGAGEEVDDAC